jgi:5-methylcytosine-specific restriction endonuclease McrA
MWVWQRFLIPSSRPPRALRRLVAERARWRCEYCHSPATFPTQPFNVDHIIPRSKNGLTSLENLALACGCNSYKGDGVTIS